MEIMIFINTDSITLLFAQFSRLVQKDKGVAYRAKSTRIVSSLWSSRGLSLQDFCAIIPTSFGAKGPNLRRLIAQSHSDVLSYLRFSGYFLGLK